MFDAGIAACKAHLNEGGILACNLITPLAGEGAMTGIMAKKRMESYFDRVELYTAGYAAAYASGREAAIAPYAEAAAAARECGLGLNAGHDLNLENLAYFIHTIPWTDEVSIGHAVICDALYMGLERTIAAYLGEIQKK